jgi:hypothetical protein
MTVYAKRRSVNGHSTTEVQPINNFTVRTHLSIIREAAAATAVVIGCFGFISVGHATSSLEIILNIWTHTNTAYGIITGVREVCSLPSVNTTVSNVHHPESVQLLPAHPAMHFKIRTVTLLEIMRPCPVSTTTATLVSAATQRHGLTAAFPLRIQCQRGPYTSVGTVTS